MNDDALRLNMSVNLETLENSTDNENTPAKAEIFQFFCYTKDNHAIKG